MNDLQHNLIPTNQHDLEQLEQGEAFPAEPDEIEADKVFHFYVYPFLKMEEWILNVEQKCTKSTFGLKLAQNPQYGCAYLLNVIDKSSAGYILSSRKATCRAIQLSYVAKTAGHCVFSNTEVTTVLSKLSDAGVCEFHITFALQSYFTARQK